PLLSPQHSALSPVTQEQTVLEQLEGLLREALAALDGVNREEGLRAWEQKYLGKKGSVTELVRSVGQIPKEERAAFGKRANEIKNALTEAFNAREALVE